MPPTASLRDLIRSTHEALKSDDHRLIAEQTLKNIGLDATQINYLLAITTDEVRRTLRLVTRDAEEDAFATIGSANVATTTVVNGVKKARKGKPVVPNAARNALVDETFVYAPGKRVKWLDATIEQHESRITWLLGNLASVNETIDRHRTAVEMIRNTPGAKCLRDVK